MLSGVVTDEQLRNCCRITQKKKRPDLKTGRLKYSANYLEAAEPVTCKIICVPLSSLMFLLAELMTEALRAAGSGRIQGHSLHANHATSGAGETTIRRHASRSVR